MKWLIYLGIFLSLSSCCTMRIYGENRDFNGNITCEFYSNSEDNIDSKKDSSSRVVDNNNC